MGKNHKMKRRMQKWEAVKPNVLLFYICYSVFIISTMFKQVLVLGDVMGQIYQICLVLLALTCIVSISRMPKKKMLLLYLITLLIFVTKITTGSSILLSLWLLIVAGRNIKFDDIVKYDLMIKIPALIILPCLYFSGLTYTNIYHRDGEIRHSMGFANPNTFSTYVMAALAEILYLRRNNLGIFDILLVIVSIFLIDYYADSQTQITCIIVLAVILFINKMTKKKHRSIKANVFKNIGTFIIDHAFSILLILSLCIVGVYSLSPNGAKESLNELSHNRTMFASEMMNEYDVNLFGQKVELIYGDRARQTGEDVRSLDNAYVYLLLMYGLVVTVLYAFFMKKYMQRARLEGNIIRYIMLIYLVGGLMEHFLLLPQTNIFLLYFSYMLYNDMNKNLPREHDMKEIDG